MDIKTKLNINDTCFFLTQNMVRESEIESISISAYSNLDIRISYMVKKNPAGSQYTTRFDENDIFKTKEDLLKSL